MEESKKTKGPEEDSQNRQSHLCVREESKKTKGPEKDKQNFDYPLQALWFSCSPPSDICGLSLF
jgi:hypothetical protein